MNAVVPMQLGGQKPRSKLKAVKPETAKPSHPKILVFGKPGVGKTWASLQWPLVYYVDTEGGANLEHYTARLAEAGGVYFGPDQGARDPVTVLEQVQGLATERHPYKTLVIDSISQLWTTIIANEQAKLGSKDAYGASKKPARAYFRQIVVWCEKLDMNVILIAHERDVWGTDGKTGVTYDGDEKLEYQLHLALNVFKQGPARLARVGKSRLLSFPEGHTFKWDFDTFADLYGRDVIEREAEPIVLASENQVQEIERLLSIVKIPEEIVEKWKNAANAESWSEFEADKLEKCLTVLRNKLAGETQ